MILVEDGLKIAQIAWGNLYNWKKYCTFAMYYEKYMKLHNTKT